MTDLVILLHGIGRSVRSMSPVSRSFRRAGYETIAIPYPWRRLCMAELAEHVAGVIKSRGVCGSYDRIHFVTHSMGGLVVRQILDRHRHVFLEGKMGRVVMLAPPNGGSEVADLLKSLPAYRWLFGPAGQELVTTVVRPTLPSGIEVGVIAGDRGRVYPLGMLAINGRHDGRVSVERSRLEGMTDHLVVPVSHTVMPLMPSVHRQAIHFIREGRFA